MDAANDHIRFEEQYISLRRKEGRLYTDEEVKQLPGIRETHPLKNEWAVRKESCRRLVKHLSKKRRPLRILEVGCGNGWLCNQLLKIPQSSVEGIDINATELSQAQRAFPAIRFAATSIESLPAGPTFDAIVFAASFQYFPSPKEILSTCFSLLKKDGEINGVE